MHDPVKVTFGGRDFAISPYPLVTIRKLGDMLHSGRRDIIAGGNPLNNTLDFIFAGLSAADSSFKKEEFDALHVAQDEINSTYTVICKQAGFKAPEKGGDVPLEVKNRTGTN